MMKISKPILANEFLLSSVQFTSLNSIVFKNVKNVYEENEKIVLEYEHSSAIEASSRDWIGIFPRGWSTLQQYINFEWVSQSSPTDNYEQNKENADLIRRTVNFCPKYLASVNKNSFYQFVYISKQIEVLGVSSYFRFDFIHTNGKALELECLVPVSSKLRSTSVSDFGVLGNSLTSTTSLDTRTLQTSSIHSLQNLDAENKNWAKPPISLNSGDLKKQTIFPRKVSNTGDALDPYTSHSEPVFPMSFQMAHCKKCFHTKRGGEFLRSQQVLQSKVGQRSEEIFDFGVRRRTLAYELPDNKLKIVMERNKVLEERTQEMKKEMEKLQNESKKLKMSFFNANKEKVAYEKFVKDFIKSLEKDSIVRVVNGNTEILVKKVNYVGMEEHPRGKKTSKRERELKAVIGLQEITIRNLINSLQEKAKSVQELNQTVKLAQAFSSARSDPRDYGSDVEEGLDEVSNSDVSSEYEFSLTKPQPPEESVVEDTDTVLDDIRRVTEMELKDIGINRTFGKSPSRDSDLALPNLSVHSFHTQNEGTRPKKPRLFDNLEDCWPFSGNTPKTVHRKVLETSPRFQNEDIKNVELEQLGIEETVVKKTDEPEKEDAESKGDGVSDAAARPCNSEETNNFEDYYDAYEDSESNAEKSEKRQEGFEDLSDDAQSEKKNFLITAIVPQDTPTKSEKVEKNWMTMDQGEALEKKIESAKTSGKKFTCNLSIDFTAKRNEEKEPSSQPAIESQETLDENQKQICNQCEVNPTDLEMKQEKPLITFKKSNKCVEIKITQMDQKDVSNKNLVQQKMVVKFAKDAQPQTGLNKPSQFEFNLAVSAVGDGKKVISSDADNLSKNAIDLKLTEDVINGTGNVTPRTVWNDATDNLADRESLLPEDVINDDLSQTEIETYNEEKQSEVSEIINQECAGNRSSMKSYEDSLRYEKNLEFLQQKTNDKVRDEEDVSKDKPSAILIQNGQTKLALIRYQ